VSRFNSAQEPLGGELDSDTRTFEEKTRNEISTKARLKSNITSITAAQHEKIRIQEEKTETEEAKEKTERQFYSRPDARTIDSKEYANLKDSTEGELLAQSKELEPKINFFLTGINLEAQPELDEQVEEQHETQIEVKEEEPAHSFIKAELTMVIDNFRVIQPDQCFIFNENNFQLMQLHSQGYTRMAADKFIFQSLQVQQSSMDIVRDFANKEMTNRIIFNVADQGNTNNIGGFNLTNFQEIHWGNQNQEKVIEDYKNSLVGGFLSQIMDELADKKYLSLYFSITKCEGDMGYSLVQSYKDVDE